MKSPILTAAILAGTMACPVTASAEVLDYNFSMLINSISDGYASDGAGVFDEWSVGDYLDISVSFNSTANTANLTIAGMDLSAGTIYSTWSGSYYSSSENNWGAYGGMAGADVEVNGVDVGSGGYGYNAYLDFAPSSLLLGVGSYIEFRVSNSHNAMLTAVYSPTPPPTAVPELDPKSGLSAFALLGGGLALAFSRRRRDQFGLLEG